jgi:D-alanyl-D-alanine carboxypeptidase/D-alanyl-D-alanine-endopeptidase (penicillin-binding protein 4)
LQVAELLIYLQIVSFPIPNRKQHRLQAAYSWIISGWNVTIDLDNLLTLQSNLIIMTRRYITSFLTLLCITAIGYAATMQDAVNKFAATNMLKHGNIGVCVRDIESDSVLASLNPDESITTASTMKTVTTSTALKILGKGFCFHTKVLTHGALKKNGTFTGNIVIVGGGDPTLGSQYFPTQPDFVAEIVDGLKSAGIKKIKGNIFVKDTLYTASPTASFWENEDISCLDGNGIHAFNYRDNITTLTFDASGSTPANFTLNPDVPDLRIVSHLTTDSTGNGMPLDIRLEAGTPALILYGSVERSDEPIQIICANPSPSAVLIGTLRNAITASGIKLKTSDKMPEDAVFREILDYQSPQLQEICKSLLERSDNMFAEGLLRAICVKKGIERNFKSGGRFVTSYWKSRGLDTDGLFINDGSGLARRDKLTASFLTSMLRLMALDNSLGLSYPSLLPLAGLKTSTLRHVLNGTQVEGKIALKSGSMTNVQCYTGYFPADKPRYTVAVLVNNYTDTHSQLMKAIQTLLLDLFGQNR